MFVFLSTLSLRRATGRERPNKARYIFLSTLSLRRATSLNLPSRPIDKISIHALLAESDAPPYKYNDKSKNFYPRSPCGERLSNNSRRKTRPQFLSTLSLRRATVGASESALAGNISIHALLAESDARSGGRGWIYLYFYPRSPCGERRTVLELQCVPGRISIHALLAESDLQESYLLPLQLISIHALLAESDERANSLPNAPPKISIHALLAESDKAQTLKIAPLSISIHALLAESDFRRSFLFNHYNLFLSTLSLRRATWARGSRVTYVEFLSTLSLRRATCD